MDINITTYKTIKPSSSSNDSLINSEQVEMEFCLICCSQVHTTRDDTQLLSKNLDAIYLLKNLLQIPDSQLKSNLKEFGDPVNWINLCENCSQLTSKALNFHYQINKLEREICSIKNIILDKVNKTSVKSSPRSNTFQLSANRKVWTRTRNFVKKSKFNDQSSLPENQFIEGDKLALKYQHDMLAATVSNSNGDVDIVQDYPSSPDVKVEAMADILSDDEAEGGTEWNLSDDGSLEAAKPKTVNPIKNKRWKKRIVVNGKMKCNYCDKDFFNKSTCYKHEGEEHSSLTSGQFICDICGKLFGANENLWSHKYRAHKIKSDGTPALISQPHKPSNDDQYIPPPTCKICLKTFSTQPNLSKHVKIVHERKLSYSCQLCEKKFRNSSKLKMHMLRIHKEDPLTKQLEEEGIRLWKCTQKGCAADFLHESSLEAHMKKGTHDLPRKQKLFICDICGSKYSRRGPYVKHRKLAHNLEEKRERGDDNK